MITARNEFETIEAFTPVAGSSFGNQTDRETTLELIEAVYLTTHADSTLLWKSLAKCSDEDTQTMFDIQQDAADLLNEHAPLASYCFVDLRDNEWIVLPYLDDDLPRFEDTPESFEGDHVLTITDHGNVSCMYWHYPESEYREVWAMV